MFFQISLVNVIQSSVLLQLFVHIGKRGGQRCFCVAGSRRQEAGKDLHHRALAGAVGPEETYDLAAADLE